MRYAAVALTAGVILASGAVNAPEAAAVGTVTGGQGWTLLNAEQTTSLVPGTYTVQFDSIAARDKLSPYLRIAAANTTARTPDVTFVVSSTIQRRVTTGCQTYRTIVVSLDYRPITKPGYSWGANCYNLTDHSLWSGVMRIDTEWFTPKWFSADATTNERRIRNGVTHEFGHAIGLGHPNVDLDHDGTVEDAECPVNADGTRPVMCSPNGGALTATGAGNWTAMDRTGLTALVTNYAPVRGLARGI